MSRRLPACSCSRRSTTRARCSASFVPREAYTGIEIGPRIGDAAGRAARRHAQQVEQAPRSSRTRCAASKLGDILRQRATSSRRSSCWPRIEQQARMPMVRIGEALLALGLITEAQLTRRWRSSRPTAACRSARCWCAAACVSREDLQTALARKMGYPLVDVGRLPGRGRGGAHAALRRRARACTRCRCCCATARLVVAMDDPSRRAGSRSSSSSPSARWCRCWRAPATIDDALLGRPTSASARDVRTRGSDADAPAARRVRRRRRQQAGRVAGAAATATRERRRAADRAERQLARAPDQHHDHRGAQRRACRDIHIETLARAREGAHPLPQGRPAAPYLELPHTYRSAIVARMKIMCDLDISERRKPQDGKINFAKFSPAHRLELRVATIPTNNGLEDVVMRLLASAQADADGPARPVGRTTSTALKRGDRAALRHGAVRGPHRHAARPPRCTRRSATSTRPSARSGPPRIRSRSRSPACARCRSTRRSTGPSPRRCAPSCAPTRT